MNTVDVNNTPISEVVKPNFFTCKPNDNLQDVAKLMSEMTTSSILVMDKEEVLGIWTERDALEHSAKALESTVLIANVMTSPVKHISSNHTISQVAEQFKHDCVRHYLVLDERGNKRGIISQSDLVFQYSLEFFLMPKNIGSIVKPYIPTVNEYIPLAEASKLMLLSMTDALAVEFNDGEIGIITERDIVKAIGAGQNHAETGAYASKPMLTLNEQESIYRVITFMLQHKCRHIGVNGMNDELIGIVNLTDVLAGINQSKLKDRQHIIEDQETYFDAPVSQLQFTHKAVKNASEGIIITDKKAIIISCNKGFTDICGYHESEVLGKTPAVLSSGRHDKDFYQTMWQHVIDEGRWQGEIWNKRKNNQVYPQLLTITVIKDREGEVTHYAGVFNDISQLKLQEEEINKLAFYDPLTGLANKRLFENRLEYELKSANLQQSFGALLYLNLDNFKKINDRLDYSKGDLLLERVAERLKKRLKSTNTLARLNGDEFIIILPNLGKEKQKSAEAASCLAEKIRLELANVYSIEEQTLHISVSIGITLFPNQDKNLEALLKQADTAMNHAKDNGQNQVQFFNPQMQTLIMERLSLEHELWQALEKNQLRLYYQPQFDNKGLLTGVEALIRWPHPEKGFINPADFINVAEYSELIIHLGNWSIDVALSQLKQWTAQGFTPPKLSLNISPKYFKHDNFVEFLFSKIEQYQLAPSLLTLEIPEQLLVAETDNITCKIHKLKNIGVSFSLNDFGTGHSSLKALQEADLDDLKIVPSLLSDLKNEKNNKLAAAIISMAKSLELKTTAVGIENEQQFQVLNQLGCEYYQGSYFSNALSACDFYQYANKCLGTEIK
ncbi:MAG: EAL domain-containing protein [Methylococcaceae bacterium]|nr:EAL domain-containing protein [Methylococcaceae bacterium]